MDKGMGGDLSLTYRSKYWLGYGYLGTLNACDQWPIDLTHYKIEFLSCLSQNLWISLVTIWSTYLFEIEHRWAKWLISDTSPKERVGSMILWSVFRSHRSVIRWILFQSGFYRSLIWKWIFSKGTPQIRNPDPDSPKGTHPRLSLNFCEIQCVSGSRISAKYSG